MMGDDRFWLFDWLDENEISTSAQIDTILSENRQFKALQAAAIDAGYSRPTALTNDRGIVAGRGIDLTGVGSCVAHRECIKRQVDTLLRRCWHYFDEIVVDDMTAQLGTASFKKLNREAVAGWLEALLYLRSLGAEHLVTFASKNIYCTKCHREHAETHFHNDLDTLHHDLVSLFEREFTVVTKPSLHSKAYVHASLVGPYLDGSYGEEIAKTKLARLSDASVKRSLIEKMLKSALRQLTDDSMTAVNCNATLGSATRLENFLLKYTGSVDGDISNAIAFSLQLPYVREVSLVHLLRIREEEHDALEAFRSRLRLAIHERTKAAESSDISAISKEIQEDLIDPELTKLRLALARNAETISKTVVGAGLAFFGGIVGLISPPLQPAGAGSVAVGVALSAAAINTFKERNALRANDLYFLLDAERDHS